MWQRWYDGSVELPGPDGAFDAPGRLNFDTFRMVPGDTIRGSFEIDAALEGANMIADLGFTVAGTPVEGDDVESLLPGLDITYSVYDAEHWWDPIEGFEDLPMGTTSEPLLLRSDDNTASSDVYLPGLPADLDGEGDFSVTVTVTFKESIKGQDLVRAKAQLQDLGVTLTQTRREYT